MLIDTLPGKVHKSTEWCKEDVASIAKYDFVF